MNTDISIGNDSSNIDITKALSLLNQITADNDKWNGDLSISSTVLTTNTFTTSNNLQIRQNPFILHSIFQLMSSG